MPENPKGDKAGNCFYDHPRLNIGGLANGATYYVMVAQMTRYTVDTVVTQQFVGYNPVTGDPIYVPAICLVELIYLVEKNRLPIAARERLIAALDDPERPTHLVAMDRAIVDAIEFVSRAEVPDMPDRIIAATALALQLPLISRDSRIQASQVKTIW